MAFHVQAVQVCARRKGRNSGSKQLRLARYLAAGGSPPSWSVEPVRQPRTPKRAQPIAKAGAKTKAERLAKKAREEELAKERRRAGQKGPSSAPHQSERGPPSPNRKAVRTCIFCGGAANSREHIIAQRIIDRMQLRQYPVRQGHRLGNALNLRPESTRVSGTHRPCSLQSVQSRLDERFGVLV